VNGLPGTHLVGPHPCVPYVLLPTRLADGKLRLEERWIISSMTTEKSIEFGSASVTLDPLPIRAEWVIEGTPVAKAKMLWRSLDGTSRTVIWDCTAGRFNWFYDNDETVYILEGSVAIKDQQGISRLVSAGDTVYFRAGSQAEWTVERYVRKVAFFRAPVPKYALLAIRIVRVAARLANFGRRNDKASTMMDA